MSWLSDAPEILEEATVRMALNGDFGPEIEKLAEDGETGFDIYYHHLTNAQQLKAFDGAQERRFA